MQTSYLLREPVVGTACASRILNSLVGKCSEEDEVSYRAAEGHRVRRSDEAEDENAPTPKSTILKYTV